MTQTTKYPCDCEKRNWRVWSGDPDDELGPDMVRCAACGTEFPIANLSVNQLITMPVTPTLPSNQYHQLRLPLVFGGN